MSALGRAPAPRRRDNSVSQPPGRHKEAGVADHAMLGADRQAVHVPAPQQRFPRRRLIEAALAAQRLHGARQLRGGGDVAADEPAFAQRPRRRVRVLPRRQHVQHDPVERLARVQDSRDAVGWQFAGHQPPGRMRGAEIALHIAPRDLGEVGTALVGDDQAALADRPEQPAGQRARARPGFDDPRAGEDVGHRQDLPGVLRVDHRSTAAHGQRVVGQQRPQGHVGGTAGGDDHAALWPADQVVVRQRAAVRVAGPSGLQDQPVAAPLGVGELNLVARGERAAWLLDHARQVNGVHQAPAKAWSRSLVASTPKICPEGSMSRYSVAGARCTASMSSIPDRSADSTSPGSMARASEPTSIHGLRCGGVAMTAVSLTIAIGVDSWSTTTSARACASSARRIASASGTLPGIAMARRASLLACSPGSRSRTFATLMACPELNHMNTAMTANQRMYVLVRLSFVPSSATGTSISSTARPRPAQAAAIVAVPGRPVTFHTPARSIRPPSSGSPGSRLKTPTTRLARISCSISTRGMPPRLNAKSSPMPMPARASDVSGPTTDTLNSLAGVGGSCSISEKPPSGYSRMRRTVSWNARATTQWLSSCTSTDAYSRITNVADTA